MQRWLGETKADVVCVQELKAPDEKFPLQAIQDAGYNAIWHGQKSWNGVAILAGEWKPAKYVVCCPEMIMRVIAGTLRRKWLV